MNIIEKNPRKNDNAVEYVANSISKTKKQASNDGINVIKRGALYAGIKN